MTIAEVSEVLIGVAQSKQISPRQASALVQAYSLLMKTLAAPDLEARVTRLEEQMAEQVLAAPPNGGPGLGPSEGKCRAGRRESVEPDGKLGARSEEEVSQRTRAESHVEQGDSSNSVARTNEEAAITKPSEKQE